MPETTAQMPIFIALGSNLSSKAGSPLATMQAALTAMGEEGLTIVDCSRWYESEPVPASSQPWFVNGVVSIATLIKPYKLLNILNKIEFEFGRSRTVANAPRPLDLDLLAYGDVLINDTGAGGLILPHPRLAERRFVLMPLSDIAPDWRHPLSGKTVSEMAASLPAKPVVRLLKH